MDHLDLLPGLADCDCCGRFRKVSQAWLNGIETWACDECRNWPAEEDDDGDR